MYEIEKNVPMPELNHEGRHEKYPWRAMEIGDSFFVDNVEKFSKRYKSIVQSACVAGRKLNKKFSTRYMDGGVRVWRVR